MILINDLHMKKGRKFSVCGMRLWDVSSRHRQLGDSTEQKYLPDSLLN
jgi:hypothetical protein